MMTMTALRRRGRGTPEVCRLAGVSFRQLDYWSRLGLVSPSVAECWGSGTRRLWSDDDVAAVRAVGLLMAHRIGHAAIAAALEALEARPAFVWVHAGAVGSGSLYDLVQVLSDPDDAVVVIKADDLWTGLVQAA